LVFVSFSRDFLCYVCRIRPPNIFSLATSCPPFFLSCLPRNPLLILVSFFFFAPFLWSDLVRPNQRLASEPPPLRVCVFSFGKPGSLPPTVQDFHRCLLKAWTMSPPCPIESPLSVPNVSALKVRDPLFLYECSFFPFGCDLEPSLLPVLLRPHLRGGSFSSGFFPRGGGYVHSFFLLFPPRSPRPFPHTCPPLPLATCRPFFLTSARPITVVQPTSVGLNFEFPLVHPRPIQALRTHASSSPPPE